MTETVDAPTTPAVEKASLFEDFIDIFVSPAQVFARRANSGFVAVTTVLTVLLTVLTFANQGSMQGIMDAEFDRQVQTMQQQNPNMTSEQAQTARAAMEKFGGYMKYIVIVAIPLIVLVLGLGIWLVGKLFGAGNGYGAAAMIAAYAYLPRVLEAVLVAVQGLVLDTGALRGRYQLSLGVGRFLDPNTTSAGLLGLLGRVDVFTIWVTILIGIGISVVGKIPRSKAMLAAAVIWVLGAVPSLFALVRGG
ncbi:MAG: YIP1 family protein [Gemmatimonadota bacterium]|nr:YIP1 family protein [Gemmatimonadota bacterium]